MDELVQLIDPAIVSYLQVRGPWDYETSVVVDTTVAGSRCDVCGRKVEAVIKCTNEGGVFISLCLVGRCGYEVLGEAKWKAILFKHVANSDKIDPKHDASQKLVEDLLRWAARSGLKLSEPLQSVVAWQKEKGFLSHKQQEWVKREIQSRKAAVGF